MDFDLPMGPPTMSVSEGSMSRRVLPNSLIDQLAVDLREQGALFGESDARDVVDSDLRRSLISSFTYERLIASTDGLLSRDPAELFFCGGVCALSTRESALAKRGLVETTDGIQSLVGMDDDQAGMVFAELAETVTVTQVLESIGLTPFAGMIVVENDLWTDRTYSNLIRAGASQERLYEFVQTMIESRNASAAATLERLRSEVFLDPDQLRVVTDREVMDELLPRTDALIQSLGLTLDRDDTYRLMYAGMYGRVWRDVLISAGVQPIDQLTVIYEPSKHFLREDSRDRPISLFREKVKEKAPYLVPGSANERVGLMAFVEPRDPNGRFLRKSVPSSLLPNSINFREFDFTKFPVIPKKSDRFPSGNEFGYFDDPASINLRNNPVFIWASIYPPLFKTLASANTMIEISKTCSDELRRNNAAFRVPGEQRRQMIASVTRDYREAMGTVATQLAKDLRAMTIAMFGGTK